MTVSYRSEHLNKRSPLHPEHKPLNPQTPNNRNKQTTQLNFFPSSKTRGKEGIRTEKKIGKGRQGRACFEKKGWGFLVLWLRRIVLNESCAGLGGELMMKFNTKMGIAIAVLVLTAIAK